MYDFFRGRVASIDAKGHCSFEVAGVGYLLRISEQTRQAIPLDGSDTVLHARLAVKEDDLQLFGFADIAERAAFDLVTTVPGIGPGLAMELLSAFTVDELRAVLAAKDSRAIQAVKGLGKKSAERLVLELADKIERIPAGSSSSAAGTSPARVAGDDIAERGLIALGFHPREAAQALNAVDAQLSDPGERLRAALAILR